MLTMAKARKARQRDPALRAIDEKYSTPEKSLRGGPRAGAGRKTIYPGERVRVGMRLTAEAWQMVQDERARLEPEHKFAATDAAATESLIRAGYKHLHRKVK